ncbi:hypothetical protein MMP66_17230 [Acinetobacter dispersus]|uniref:hypothetical protein n=1 Tax=Acinetobacter dispersus TaxID=70348 RepID=UPI001F4B41E1|nr:hypothetical protein [Acinetobacter dispersus]MCH7395990.1 hypothetical protein [Acinetobacter dispersus]
MTELINKGGFRERANRSRKYKQSENEVTTLQASQYQPQNKAEVSPTPTSKQTQAHQDKKDEI